MPKKPPRNNPRALELRTVHSAGSGAAALLQRISRRAQVVLPAGAPAGADAGQAASGWLERLRPILAPEQRDHLLEVIEKHEELVLFVDSAAWAGRIRLALPELAAVTGGRRLAVRLRPAGPARKR